MIQHFFFLLKYPNLNLNGRQSFQTMQKYKKDTIHFLLW
jgi:hypothetical protein